MLSKTGRLPSIPEYYKEMIDRKVDLESEPHQLCPFHEDKTTPSFSYSRERGVWRCFGGCKCGGDVVDLHRKNYGLSTREEAQKSLDAICGIVRRVEIQKVNVNLFVNESKVECEQLYQKALVLADTPERWLELDYFMSKVPIEFTGLQDLVLRWEELDKEV